ncbi:MAG TPA: permease-like cell division protein FtsX [Thermoanaerobaculia bacterium]|nr:permease-like cell division protein FtsX [Thermoanaerobaculia bacterium]
MKVLQALRYFFREAAMNLLRSWKVSLLAVLTIAVSLFIGGAFLLVSGNLSASVERWRGEMRVVIYLRPETADADLRRLAAEAARGPAVTSVEPVTAAAARKRFQEVFPSLSNLVAGWQDEPLPASLEIGLDPRATGAPGREAWLAGWRKRPEVTLVDDDREWLGQLETVVAVVRAVGLALVAGLLGAAIFTIASVIRLTAYLHHQETEVMRLVGATEFFIRGPFYVEGLLQGLIGGLVASGALYGVYQAVHARGQGSLFSTILTLGFLPLRQVAFLVLLGGAAGLFGAVASLRREAL